MMAPSGARISVVVVSHNEGENLVRTVEGLRAALPEGAEVLVVDDFSTDGSTDALPAASARVVRPESRLGIAPARNWGASLASGDVLIFSDAHIDVPSGFLSPILEALAQPRVAAAGPVIAARGDLESKGHGFRWRDAALNAEWLGRKGDVAYPVPLLPGGFVAFRRDVFERLGGFDPGLIVYGLEDAEISLHAWTMGYRCLLVPEVEVVHLFREVQPYAVDWSAMLYNLLRVAVVHFRGERCRRVFATLRGQDALPTAFARLVESDAWERRREIQGKRNRDDDWFFHAFHMHW